MAKVMTGVEEGVTLFRDGRYVRYWLARLLSIMGFQMMSVLVGWDVYAQSHSTFYLGLVGLVQFTPMLLATLPAGYVADHFDRRTVLQVVLAMEMVATGVLAWAAHEGWASVGLLLAIAAVVATLRTFERPAFAPLLPALVTAKALPQALSVATSGTQTALILGPALGGFIYMGGAHVAYAAVAVCYLVSSLCVAGIALKRTPRVKKPMSVVAMVGGFKYIWQNQILLGAISLDLMAVLLGGAVALLPVYAQDILHVDAMGLGILRGASAVGALAGSIWLARRPLKRNAGRAMFGAVAVFGVATIVFGLSHWFVVSFLALMVAGGADVVSVVVRSTLEQLRTPDEMRGRVSSVNALFIGTSNQLGEFESGMAATVLGTVPSVVVGGIGTLLVVALWMRLFPELRDVDKLA